VHGLESYGIAPQPLADELRKTCAGSTSVERMQGSSPKNPVMEVMVQGPQKDAIMKELEKRGVLRGWVEVVDKTKKKK
jgi:translation initiation factor 2D